MVGDKNVYLESDQTVRSADATVPSSEWNGESRVPSKITVEFLTPTILKSDGVLVSRPEFHHLIKRLRDRISSLFYFYHGHRTLPIDFREFGAVAERDVHAIRAEISWVERSRTSWRRGVTQDQSGFIGAIQYEGKIAPFLPLLLLGQWTHVGKSAVWGQVWIRVTYGS